jgi:hypothetical protein
MASFSLPGFAFANAVAQSSGVKGSAATRIGLVGGLFGGSPIGILVAKRMADSEAKRSDGRPPDGKSDVRANNGLVVESAAVPASGSATATPSPKRA